MALIKKQALLFMMATVGCSVFARASVEEAPYQLVKQDGDFEIRDYASVVVAQTEVNASLKKAGNTAFRRLFDYISGNIVAGEEIAMTAPVIAESDGPGITHRGRYRRFGAMK